MFSLPEFQPPGNNLWLAHGVGGYCSCPLLYNGMAPGHNDVMNAYLPQFIGKLFRLPHLALGRQPLLCAVEESKLPVAAHAGEV